ncbi:MAG: S9 family peptidase, partial [Pelagerythrobacter marensis]
MTDATKQSAAKPPVAAKKPSTASHHGQIVTDDYAWLRDPAYPEVSDPEVLAYLEAENAWFRHKMAPQQALVDTLFAEMRARIKEADRSVPQKDGDWLYWIEFEEGAEYKKWWRRPVSEYFRLGALAISPSGRYLAWSSDTDGSERYTIRFRDLTGEQTPAEAVPGVSGKWGDSEVEGTIGNIVWTAQEDAVLYSLTDDHWRHRTIKLHRIGTDPASDAVIYDEPDEGFSCGVALGAEERWIILTTGDHDTSEIRLIPADDPLAAPILVRPRQAGVEYDVDLRGDTVFVHTNDTHENFRLATAPLAAPGEWATLIDGSDAFYLTGFELFRDFYVVEGRIGGLDR